MPLPPFDAISTEFNQNPYPLVQAYRKEAPLFWNEPFQSWVFFTHETIKFALTDRRFTNNRTQWDMFQGYDPLYPNLNYINQHSPFNDDNGPSHMANRKMAVKVFSAKAIERLHNDIKTAITDILKKELVRGSVNFAKDISPKIPFEVASRMVGVPDLGERKEDFIKSCVLLADSFDPMLTPEQKAACDQGAKEVLDEVRRLIAERKQDPRDDLITDFTQALADYPQLNEDNIAVIIAALISSGSRGTVFTMNMVIKSLYEHPDQLRLLKDNRALLKNAVNELTRYDSPAKFLYRFILEDIEYQGMSLKKGQCVMLPTFSANRDEQVFDNPDQLNIQRDEKQLLSSMVFGHGSHFCIGAHLARLELAELVSQFIDLVPEGSVDVKNVSYHPTDFLSRQIDELLVSVDA